MSGWYNLDGSPYVPPSPAFWLRSDLERARARGEPFDRAWSHFLKMQRCDDEWRGILEAQEDAFRRAYELGPQTGPERAVALLAESRGGIPLPDEDESLQPEGDRPRCLWCGDPLPEGHKAAMRFCPPPRRCRRESNYARERERARTSKPRTAALRAVPDDCRPNGVNLAATTPLERHAA